MSKYHRIAILSLSPWLDDHAALVDILTPSQWALHRAATFPAAMQLLQSRQIRVVICERDLSPYSWKDLLGAVAALAKPPLVIVTSRYADDYLWAEALNLGAYDVLAKPFAPAEVRRSVGFAVLHGRENRGSVQLVRAAGVERSEFSVGQKRMYGTAGA